MGKVMGFFKGNSKKIGVGLAILAGGILLISKLTKQSEDNEIEVIEEKEIPDEAVSVEEAVEEKEVE